MYVRRADGTADPASTITPTSVTPVATTFGDLANTSSRVTARFDAGSGKADGGATITVNGQTLTGLRIDNQDRSAARDVVLGRVDLTPGGPVDLSGITDVGGSVTRYTVQSTTSGKLTPGVVSVTNAAGGDVVLTQPVHNPVGPTTLSAGRSITYRLGTGQDGRVVAGDLGAVTLTAGTGSISLPVEVSHGRYTLPGAPANPRTTVTTAAAGDVDLAVFGFRYLTTPTIPAGATMTDVDLLARSTGAGSVNLSVDSLARTSTGSQAGIPGTYNLSAGAAAGDVSVDVGTFGTDQRDAVVLGSLSAPNGTVALRGATSVTDGTTGTPSVVARVFDV